MKHKHFLSAIIAALVVGVAACGEADPIAPTVDALETLELAVDQRAVVDPDDLAESDVNENNVVCVKTVPESDNADPRAGQRVIVKDDRDGQCPGGFEVTELFLPG